MIEVVFGTNSDALRRHIQQRQRELEAIHGEALAVERVDASGIDSVQQVRNQIEAGSLFHTEKLVIIRDATTNKVIADWFAEELKELQNVQTHIILFEDVLDKRSKLYKRAKKLKLITEFEALKPKDAPRFVVDYVAEHGGSISMSDATILIGRVGVNQGILVNELDKLILFNSEITEDTILQLTDQAPNDSIFALTDAITQGRPNAALSIYRDLRVRQMHPLEILATLGWQMFTLVQVKAYEHESQHLIASRTKLHPYVVGKTITLTKRLSKQQLRTAISTVADLEEQLKTSDLDPDHSFETSLLKLIELLKR